ncbi:MAG: CRISPR-associated endoribonuclease Cas6 [Desulfitobacteriaceae bacterium]|nr:CRISPR-associated endoribonuclease Cas6 [Desulfitobacteriaceae bacterium]MDD4346644.1 CRISPR-associated endoribonuclease Cas6 [Desulfitobacteriaceae bacterium]
MRLNISLKFPSTEGFPIHYHYWLQSSIYHVMEGEIADQVHTKGFEGDGRVFRLFTFSRLLGLYELSKDKKFIRFPEGANWIVSSPINDILGSIAGGLLKQLTLRIGVTSAEITGIQVMHPTVQSETIRVRTLSPVVAYSTLFRRDGSKYTVYLQPGEPEFRRIVVENLLKKWQGIRVWKQAEENENSFDVTQAEENENSSCVTQGEECLKSKRRNFNIHMLNNPKLHILEYKGGIIKGYSGLMELSGSPELLQVSIDAGLGSKNAQGCGCLEVVGRG